MKKINKRFPLLAASLMLLLMIGCADSNPPEITINEKPAMAEKVLRHVVLFKFKDEAPKEEVQKIHEAFNALPAAIPEVKDFEWGLNNSPENFHQGFTHCYMLTFDSEEDRDSVYAPHEAHQAFVSGLEPHLEKVFVVDYWTNP